MKWLKSGLISLGIICYRYLGDDKIKKSHGKKASHNFIRDKKRKRKKKHNLF